MLFVSRKSVTKEYSRVLVFIEWIQIEINREINFPVGKQMPRMRPCILSGLLMACTICAGKK